MEFRESDCVGDGRETETEDSECVKSKSGAGHRISVAVRRILL